MATEIKAPTFPESIQDGTIATWHKKAGDTVSRDELLVDIETDKVVLEVVSPTDGTLTDRKSTRLNSSHVDISYAVFCLEKKRARVIRRGWADKSYAHGGLPYAR